MQWYRAISKWRRHRLVRYVFPLLLIGLWTWLILEIYPKMDLLNLEMTYLGLNGVIALYYGQGPAILTTIASVLAFDYFFVKPFYALTVADPKYWVTFSIMFGVTLLISRLGILTRRSSEEALTAQLKAERENVISSLLSSVSHDLRTPLTSIAGASSTLLAQDSKISATDQTRLLETINHESTRLNRLVEKILQITKIESGNIQVRKEWQPLEEIIGSVLNRLDAQLEGRELNVQIPPDLMVPLDGILMEQVLINLLENAVRHTPPGSPIELRAYQDGTQVWVEVADHGAGIPAEERERIFEKFYQQGKNNAWGTGLGLAVCQGILKVHQGLIGVKDRAGGGSVFYFSLPLEN